MSIEERLKLLAGKVESELSNVLPALPDESDDLVRAMRYAVLGGGKRLRPILLILTGNLLGITDEYLVKPAAALELVHCYSLIHDDLPCMDDDDFRRGSPTVHREFGEATAVLAGDSLLTLAFEVLADSKVNLDHQIRLSLVTELARASGTAGMVGGQMLDLLASDLTPTRESLERMQQLKTGALFRFAVLAGCTIGKASQEGTEILVGFAEKFGLAYQIADDIADERGETAERGGDSATGLTLEASNFVTIFGVEKAKRRVDDLRRQCKKLLLQFEDRGQALSQFVDYIFA